MLVNGKTASASEIVAGALQDHDRATVIGKSALARGWCRASFRSPRATGLALTTALYYTPSGRSIQKPFGRRGLSWGAHRAIRTAQSEFQTDAGRM